MIKEIWVGIVSIAGFAGAVWLGTEIESRISSSEQKILEEAAYQRGYAEGVSSYKAVEGPLSDFANGMRELFKSETLTEALPEQFRKDLDIALSEAAGGNLNSAIASLPRSAELVDTPSCIRGGNTVQMKEHDFIDLCEGNVEFVFNTFWNGGSGSPIRVSVNGELTSRLDPGSRLELPNGCIASFLQILNAEDRNVENKALIRFTC